jgi:hypothetical protein
MQCIWTLHRVGHQLLKDRTQNDDVDIEVLDRVLV